MFRVRPLDDQDTDACIALWRRCGLVVPHNDPALDLDAFRKADNAEVLVAERQGKFAGSVCVGHDGHRGWVYYLAVDPELQRHGIGRLLMRQAEAWLAERGLRKVQLMIRPSNESVQRFYQQIGYSLTPRLVLARWLDGTAGNETDDGELDVVITYLEMTERPSLAPIHPPVNRKVALLRAEHPSIAFYRFLYDTVGEPWLWWERRALDDEALAAIIGEPRVEIYVLYVDGVPGGYFELDRRQSPEIELAYFGLIPNFISQGLGSYLLYSAIEIAWDHEPERLRVHTNSLDHPKALPLYQRMGFVPYAQEKRRVPDPRRNGLIPPQR